MTFIILVCRFNHSVQPSTTHPLKTSFSGDFHGYFILCQCTYSPVAGRFQGGKYQIPFLGDLAKTTAMLSNKNGIIKLKYSKHNCTVQRLEKNQLETSQFFLTIFFTFLKLYKTTLSEIWRNQNLAIFRKI